MAIDGVGESCGCCLEDIMGGRFWHGKLMLTKAASV
jgi:hypothetical protein